MTKKRGKGEKAIYYMLIITIFGDNDGSGST